MSSPDQLGHPPAPWNRDPRGAWESPGRPRPHARTDRYPAARHERAPRSGGAAGNERLTAMTGAILLLLLAAEGVTILRIGRLLTLHFFIGMLLLGPVALKAGSTVYRFARYYSGSAPYRRKGPPAPLLRLLGPVLMILTFCVFGSGVALAYVGPGRSGWLLVHKGSFILWFCAMAIHVLAYTPRLPRLLAAEAHGGRAAAVLSGRGTRVSLLIASLVAGLVIAMLTVHLAGPWQFFRNH